MNIKKIRTLLLTLLTVAILAIGIFALTGCGGEKCTEHDFETHYMVIDCHEGGTMARECRNCGYYEELPIEPKEHTYTNWTVQQEATCHSFGYRRAECDFCRFETSEEIPKLPHTVESWSVQLAPTETEVGKAGGSCSADGCNESLNVTLPVLNETNYEIEVVDSESKNYTYKTDDYEIEVFVSNYYFYAKKVNNEIVGYYIGMRKTTTTEKLVLPSTYNGYPIIGLLSDNFMNQPAVKELVIPEGVEDIGKGIFYGHNGPFDKVVLPSTIKNYGKETWYSSGGTGFCYKITDLYYNGTVEDWCNIRFFSAIDADNVYFLNENNEYELLTEVTIPSSVTAIGDYQFSEIKSLTTVNMHEGVTSIGNYAFSSTGLTSFTMPNSVTTVGEYAFYNNKSLERIKLSENLTLISRSMFGYCSALTSISIPSGVTAIADYAFNACTVLSKVEFKLDSLLETIGKEAFFDCRALASFVMPGGVSSVGTKYTSTYCKEVYYMGATGAFGYINGINSPSYSVYYYSEKPMMSNAYTYWHFDENDNPVLWVAGTVVSGKTYNYSSTETVVSDAYWNMLKTAEAQGMLEMLFSAAELGQEIARQQIEMVTSSNTKAEYEAKLCAFSAVVGRQTAYKFENGKVTMTVNGQITLTTDYFEFDNVIYLSNGQAICYIDAENNRIYERNETEYTTVWHYYTPAV